jgi:hypothetical protein
MLLNVESLCPKCKLQEFESIKKIVKKYEGEKKEGMELETAK